MREQVEHLNSLTEMLPLCNSYRASSDLTTTLSKYKKVLDFVNSYNEEYKSATTVYYNDITDIRDNIEYTLYASTSHAQFTAFEKAKTKLKSDILALATLIQPSETTENVII